MPAIEGDRLNIKCDYSDAKKVNKIQWTKELDDGTQPDSPNILSKKSQWYIAFRFIRIHSCNVNRIVYVCRLHFKNVKNSDRGQYSCLIGGFTDNGPFLKWRNFTLILQKRSESFGVGKPLKMSAPQSLSHHKDGAKPKFIGKPYMDNNIALIIGDTRFLSCPFESKLNDQFDIVITCIYNVLYTKYFDIFFIKAIK